MSDEQIRRHQQKIKSTMEKDVKVEDARDLSDLDADSDSKSTGSSSSSGSSNSEDSDNGDTDDERPKRKSSSSGATNKKAGIAKMNEHVISSMLGKCVTLMTKLEGFDPKTEVWLKPWEGKLDEHNKQIADSQSQLKSALNGLATNQELTTFEEKMESCERFLSTLEPVRRSMLEALGKIPGATA